MALANYFVGQLNEPKPAARVVEEMISEYLDIMERFEQLNV